MSDVKKGRGHKAPYETSHIRVPLPIKADLLRLVELYREDGELPDEKLLTAFSEAVIIARKILVQKKSARVSLEKLLTALYGQEIDL